MNDSQILEQDDNRYEMLRPLQKVIAHFEKKLDENRDKNERRSTKEVPNIKIKTGKSRLRQPSVATSLQRRHNDHVTNNRLSIVPEDEIYQPHRQRVAVVGNYPLCQADETMFVTSQTMTSSLSSPRGESDNDDCCVTSDLDLKNATPVDDCYHPRDLNINTGFEMEGFQHESSTYDYSSLQRPAVSVGAQKRKSLSRRHTLSGAHRQQSHFSYDNPDDDNYALPSGYSTLRGTARDGAMSPSEADRKRSAFLRYLERRYPQHADVISGKGLSNTSPLTSVRTRASYAADNSYHSAGLTSSSNDSEITRYGSLSRGSRLRSSLPIIRGQSRSRERPLGVIYLEFSGESRAAILPNELTSLDTIRALFVHAYPGLLTMPMLDPQRHTMLLKNKKNGNFDEIDTVSRIKDRSIIRTRPTGIPTPGSKKPAINHAKPKLGALNRSKPQQKSVDDIAVAERNQKNLNQHKSGLKAPVKSLIRQYQSAPSLIKQAVTGSNPTAGDTKQNTRLPQKTNETPSKPTKGKAPTPPPRSAKPSIQPPSSKPEPAAPTPSQFPNGSLRSGNGLGGGSIPQKGFAYVRREDSPTHNQSSDSPASEVNNSNLQRGLRHPTASRLSPPSIEARKRISPNPSLKPPSIALQNVTPEPGNVSRDLSEHQSVEAETRPKTPVNVQPRQYAGSAMASQTKFVPVATQSNLNAPRSITPKGIQPRQMSLKQPNSKLNAKRPSSTSPVDGNNQLTVESNVSYSNIKRSSSPERRAAIHGTGGSAGYCRGGKSSKGQQLKPFSIPVVPEVPNALPPTTTPRPDGDIAGETSPPAIVRELPSDDVTSSPDSPDVTLVSEVSENDKTKGNATKKGLFGLRKLVTNKSGARINQKERSQNDDRPKTPVQSPLHGVGSALSTSSSSIASLRSSTSSGSSPRLMTSRLPGHSVAKSSPLGARKAMIPKSDLLSSLLSNKDQNDDVTAGKRLVSRESHDVISTSSSDEDKEHAVAPSSIAGGLTGVLKNNNLVKSTSVSSILSDSGASNLSTTPSLKTKKVSFQDDVTVCDANGISTFSNGLRQSDVDENADVAFDRLVTAFDQSLSSDVNEVDNDRRENEVLRSWRNEAANRGIVRKDIGNTAGERLRPATPRSDAQNYTQYPNQGWPHSPRVSHQSAVAAAIQSISSSHVPASTINDRELASARLRQSVRSYQQFSVSCASPVPFVTRQERHESPHKEEWSPLRRRLSADNTSMDGAAVTHQRSCVTPVPVSTLKDSITTERRDEAKESEPSYFQTQSAPAESAMRNEPFKSDTPPYYECCEPTPPSARPITPSLLNEALDSKQAHHQADASNNDISPHTDAAEVNPPLRNIPMTNPTSSPRISANQGQPEHVTKKRMMAMERQLASLTGMVESIITSSDNTNSSTPVELYQSHPPTGRNAESSHPGVRSMSQQDVRVQLMNLRETAHELKEQLGDLKRQQRTNIENINDMVNEKTKDLTHFINSTAGAQHRPLRMRRARLDQERHAYAMNASRTEKQLSDVEAAVEELRNEVVERRCRVNSREVEALVLQLSQAGRTVAQLKGSFPSLCDELRTVGAAETEVIYAEEKFVEGEPSRLDEQLKRCKQLTATLFTLKKLATVQEARSKTPTSFASIRPNTPNPIRRAWEDPNINRTRILDDVRRIRVDHIRRMESIQEAEISWTRRRKFILEHDAKKLEKALEMAEKALNRTDYISQNEQRRQAHLVQLYNRRDMNESNLTTSESSSIESLPPPPTPMEHPVRRAPSNVPIPSGYQQQPPSVLPPPPPSDLNISQTTIGDGYPVISPDVGYLSSDLSPEFGRQVIPHTNTGSLPRYHNTPRHQGYGIPPSSGRPRHNYQTSSGRQTPIQHMERSRSVTPQHWNMEPMTIKDFASDVTETQEMTEEERHRIVEQQRLAYMEKNQRLKEQYSKLQHLQKRQRMAVKKGSGQVKQVHVGVYQPMTVSPAAKSSNV